MKKNRRNNSRPAAITTAKDTTKAIETRAGVLKEAEDVKKEAKTSFYLHSTATALSRVTNTSPSTMIRPV